MREQTNKLTLSYQKLRQFKINGTIGNPGQKNCLSYTSLCYQIAQGEKMHYTTGEIYGGVIKAIEAGNPFRDVLELESEDFDKKALMKALRSHFRIRDPNDVFNELRGCVQKPNESAHAFACRCVALKKKVENMAQSENIPFDLENLRTTFFKTVYTGLRQANIRNELRQTLSSGRVTDDDLLLEVSEACAIEEERVKKMGEGGEKSVKVNKITTDSDSDEPDSPGNPSSDDFSSGFSTDNHNSHNNSHNTQNTSARKKKQAKKKQAVAAQQSKQQITSSSGFLPASSADINKLTAAFHERRRRT